MKGDAFCLACRPADNFGHQANKVLNARYDLEVVVRVQLALNMWFRLQSKITHYVNCVPREKRGPDEQWCH
jgi:hypothetical protein